MAKKIKKPIHTRREIRGQDRHERMEKAYQDWKCEKLNSLKELADKYHIHVPDLSRYITTQLELSKEKKTKNYDGLA